MAMHRDLTPRAPEVNEKGVDPVVRRKVILLITALALLAALIWSALIMWDGSAGDVIGTPVIGQQALTVTYNDQGWPIISNVMGEAVHPEDLGRVGGGVDERRGCS